MQKIQDRLNCIIDFLNNQKVVKIFLFIGSVIIIYGFISFIATRSVNIPYWDQWNLADIISGKTNYNFFELFLYQHNEHRIGVGLLIIKFLASISHWNQILEIRFISFLFVILAVIMIGIRYIINKKLEIFDIFIPLVVLNIFQAENLLWGFQITFILPLFFLISWLFIVNIVRQLKWKYLALTFLALLSSYSSLHGLILPLLTIGLIVYDYFTKERERRLIYFVAIVVNFLIVVSYFIGYAKDLQAGLVTKVSLQTVEYFVLAVSNGFFYLAGDIISAILMIIVLIFLCVGIYRLVKCRSDRNSIVGIVLLAYGLLFITLITIGRSSLSLVGAFSSRYITFSMLLPLGLFFIFSGLKRGYIYKIALFVFVAYNCFIFMPIRINWADRLAGNERAVLNCYIKSTRENIERCYKIFPLYSNEKYLNERIADVLLVKGIFPL